MVTLFSPVGTADPVTQLGDGPLLHIIRHRRPDRVVLFLSPAMTQFQRQDERYTRAIVRAYPQGSFKRRRCVGQHVVGYGGYGAGAGGVRVVRQAEP